MPTAWIGFSHRKQGVYVDLRYGRAKTFRLGKLSENSPTGLLDLVLAATRRTQSIAVLTALRDANKSIRNVCRQTPWDMPRDKRFGIDTPDLLSRRVSQGP